jgi:hypothetical protein
MVRENPPELADFLANSISSDCPSYSDHTNQSNWTSTKDKIIGVIQSSHSYILKSNIKSRPPSPSKTIWIEVDDRIATPCRKADVAVSDRISTTWLRRVFCAFLCLESKTTSFHLLLLSKTYSDKSFKQYQLISATALNQSLIFLSRSRENSASPNDSPRLIL